MRPWARQFAKLARFPVRAIYLARQVPGKPEYLVHDAQLLGKSVRTMFDFIAFIINVSKRAFPMQA